MVNVWNSDYTFPGRFRRIFFLPPVIASQGRILDWGCSRGYTTKDISVSYPGRQVTGVDINPDSIARARELFSTDPLDFIAEDGFDFLRKGERFGAIFALNNVLPWFIEGEPDTKDIRELGLLMRESLVSRALLLISAERSHDDSQHHIFAYRKGRGLEMEPFLEDGPVNPDAARLREFKGLFF